MTVQGFPFPRWWTKTISSWECQGIAAPACYQESNPFRGKLWTMNSLSKGFVKLLENMFFIWYVYCTLYIYIDIIKHINQEGSRSLWCLVSVGFRMVQAIVCGFAWAVNTDAWNGENYHLQCPRPLIALRYGKRTMLSEKFASKILRCRSVCRLCKLPPPTTLLETSISGSSSRCRRLQVLGFLFFVFLSFVKMHNDRRNLPQAAKAGVFSPRFLGGRELARNWQRWYELVVFCQVKLRSSEDVFQVDLVEMKCCQFLAVEVWWEHFAELSWQVVRNKDWDQAFYPEAMRVFWWKMVEESLQLKFSEVNSCRRRPRNFEALMATG